MLALRKVLGSVTTSAAKRSFPSSLVQLSSCTPLATERLQSSLFLNQQESNTAAMATIERRNFSTIVNDLCLVKQNATGFAVAKATDPLVSPAPSTVAAMATAVATNWLASAWNNRWNLVANTLDDAHDGLFLISTLKRRRKMMNKHKLRKRRKKNRMKNKK